MKNDARHIALASVHGGVKALVSWNFKHMVNFRRQEEYNQINARLGYKDINIRTPKEMFTMTFIEKNKQRIWHFRGYPRL